MGDRVRGCQRFSSAGLLRHAVQPLPHGPLNGLAEDEHVVLPGVQGGPVVPGSGQHLLGSGLGRVAVEHVERFRQECMPLGVE